MALLIVGLDHIIGDAAGMADTFASSFPICQIRFWPDAGE